MPEVVQENHIQAPNLTEYVLGLAGIAAGLVVTVQVNAVAGTALVIFGALVAAL